MEQFETRTNYRRMTKHSNVRAQLTENPVSFRYNHAIEISVKIHLSLNSYSDCHGRKKKKQFNSTFTWNRTIYHVPTLCKRLHKDKTFKFTVFLSCRLQQAKTSLAVSLTLSLPDKTAGIFLGQNLTFCLEVNLLLVQIIKNVVQNSD